MVGVTLLGRVVGVAWLLAGGCSSEPSAVGEGAVALPPPADTVDDNRVLPSTPTGEDVPWTPVWPTRDGRGVAAAPGRVVTAKGIVPIDQGALRCDGGYLVDGAGVVALPPGPSVSFPSAPAIPASAVERAGWRLGEVLGPATGVQPGGRVDVEPAIHQGVQVRSVRKTRRSGPPVLVVVGEREGLVAVIMTDRDAGRTLAAAVFEVEGPPYPFSGALPITDIDGDGELELIAYGSAPDGASYRASLRARLDPKPALAVLRLDTGAPHSCQGP